MSDSKLKTKPHWSECSYCCEPVGLLGRGLAYVLGSGFHGCNFSNVEGAISMEDIRPDTHGARNTKPPKEELPFRYGHIKRGVALVHQDPEDPRKTVLQINTGRVAELDPEGRKLLVLTLRELADRIEGMDA